MRNWSTLEDASKDECDAEGDIENDGAPYELFDARTRKDTQKEEQQGELEEG